MAKDKSTFDKEKDKEYAREIAQKVNYLFEHYRKPNGAKYSYTEVEEETGGAVHNSWLSKLAGAHFSRPGLQVLQVLTKFFHVDPGFWFKDLDEWVKEQEETEKQKNRQSQHQQIATTFRSQEASPTIEKFVLEILDLYDKMLEEDKKEKNNRGSKDGN